MKLAYFQDINECDPLPKLGKKVEKHCIVDHASFERAENIKAFEIGEHSIRPQWFCMDFAHDGTGYIDLDLSKPESWPALTTVSFADAAEMAEAMEKAAPTYADYIDAFDAAYERTGSLCKVGEAALSVLAPLGYGPGDGVSAFPQAFPALIAALEALQ